MKLPPKTFVIEHKRRSHKATAAPPSIWTGHALHALQTLKRTEADTESVSDARCPDPIHPLMVTGIVHTITKGRILEARSKGVEFNEPEAQSPTNPSCSPGRPRGRPRKNIVPAPTASAEQTKMVEVKPVEVADQVTEITDAPTEAIAPTTTTRTRLSPSERRREARKKLSTGERWKWSIRRQDGRTS